MKLYLEKVKLIKRIELCSDWKIYKRVLIDALYYANHEIKRPKRSRLYKQSTRRCPRAAKIERLLNEKSKTTDNKSNNKTLKRF